MFTALLSVLLLVIFTVLSVVIVRTWKKKKAINTYTNWDMPAFAVVLMLIGIVVVFPIIFGCQHGSSLYLPIKLIALNATIELQSEYITAGDAGIGAGLEGLEIKREIQQTIKERNLLIAEIEYRQISPWYYFKPEIAMQ